MALRIFGSRSMPFGGAMDEEAVQQTMSMEYAGKTLHSDTLSF